MLRAFDEAGAQVGAVRAHGTEAKTVVRIVGPPDAVATAVVSMTLASGWARPHADHTMGR